MSSAQPFTYLTQKGHTIHADLYGAASGSPLILYAHGLKGFKDWGFVPYVAQSFVDQGFSFVAFNFSHNGIGTDMEHFTEEVQFFHNTYSLEVSELREMISLCASGDLDGIEADRTVGLLGHSRGGGVALLAGQSTPEVQAITTWAAISTVDRYEKRTYDLWRKSGHLEIKNSRTGQVLNMGLDMLEDIRKNAKASLNIQLATKHLGKPLLLVHGTEDKAVPFYEAEMLNIYADVDRSHMQLIPGAGHTFGATHPFTGTTPMLEEAIKNTVNFFASHLR